ncbi:COQ9-domain-containing protein [Cokeromyces recurvatus]|uniref:COQ9-domain-containing protein n=1 Tax=Cokeromyces recurvatus TaxID=90255 RepID=UPI002220A3D3|nr:COQ9-domain-containing protein [Cokeromyces recurvatus]KAI7907185.1 COQ9-domain-containing protein [Cokeromyces recurvatus]
MSYFRSIISNTLRSSNVLKQPIVQKGRQSYLPILLQARRTFVAAPTSETPPTSLPLQKEEKALPPPPSSDKDPRHDMFFATLPFIPQYGWSMESLIHGARTLGYPSVAHGMFPGGEAGLIDAYLSYQRKAFADLVKEKYLKGEFEGLSMNERVKVLTTLRLDMNKPYIKKWPEALAIMARPSNMNMSLKHLADIADDIWYYAGDKSSDMNWYTKRGSLAAIYSAADLFMTQDQSENFMETEKFLTRKLEQAAWLGSSARQV